MLIKIYIYDTLRDLVPFAQFKNVKNTHGAVLTLLHECFSRFLNCKNGTKSRKISHIVDDLLYVIYWILRLTFTDKITPPVGLNELNDTAK